MSATARCAMRGAYRVRPSKDDGVILLTREALRVRYSTMRIEKDRRHDSVDTTCVGVSKILKIKPMTGSREAVRKKKSFVQVMA